MLFVTTLLTACVTTPPVIEKTCSCPPPEKISVPQPQVAEPLQLVSWEDLPNWPGDSLNGVRDTLLASCRARANKPEWRLVCAEASRLRDGDENGLRAFFQVHFLPYRVVNEDGSTDGLVTGYYEPVIRGSRERTEKNNTPIYGVPDDLIVVDLASLYPDLKYRRLRGRLDGRKLVPYYSRAELQDQAPVPDDKIIAWAEDPVELFFLQIQGSGLLELPDGSRARLSYADQNGHPYRSIGRLLVKQGELTVEQASLQGIHAWAAANPQRLDALLNANPSYVFFREGIVDSGGPTGALGVQLTAERSIAVDPKIIPLGAPVYLTTTQPLSDQALRQLVFAQDTGGAINGAVRADFFWGTGPNAGAKAGRMRQRGQMWVLLPKDYPLPK